MRTLSVYISLFLTFALYPYTLFAEERKPMEIARDLIESISMVKDKSSEKLKPEERKSKEKFIKKANSLIDIHGLGPKTLGPHWGKRTKKEKEFFISILTKLFERIAYPKSSKFFTDLEIKYNSEKIKKGNVEVNTTMEHESEGLIEIDYMLHRVGGRWLIYDVILDGVSLVTNLKTKLRQVIEEESFDELMNRMIKRLEKEE